MSSFILSCCSTSDLTKEHYIKKDIHYICFHFSLNGKEYLDDLGESVPFDKFYKMMEEGAITKTSQISVGEFVDYFTPFLKEGKDILHLTLSSGISGVYNSACQARDILKEQFPERKIYIVDSLAASSGYGLLMDKLADLRLEGRSIDEVRNYAEEHKLELNHWFFSTTLKYYVRGGRISKTAGAIGNLLKICPVLNVANDGSLQVREKVMGVKRAIKRLEQIMEEDAIDKTNYDGKCYICCSACYDEAKSLASLVEANFPHLDGKVEIYSIGTTIGSHTGPGTVALFYWGKKRIN